jgi:hypothetical protein
LRTPGVADPTDARRIVPKAATTRSARMTGVYDAPDRLPGPGLERTTGIEPATLSLGS